MDLFGDEDIIYDDDLPEDDLASSPAFLPVEGLCDPPLMDICLGHEAVEAQFLELYTKDKMPHAVVFSGAQGIGKTTFAFRLARFLLKNSKDSNTVQDALFGAEEIAPDVTSLDVPREDAVFSRIASGGHADLLHIKKEDTASGLKVDEVRGIEKFLRKTASEGGYRIVIIEDADTMNRNAQNAILKILEEPPKKVLLILVAHKSGMLIPTIRSRSRYFEFKPLSDDTLLELLRRNGHVFSGKEKDRLLLFASGSVGKALSFINYGGLEMLSKIMIQMEEGNQSVLHKFSLTLSGKGQDAGYYLFADIMQWIFRLLVSAKARGDHSVLETLNHARVNQMLQTHSLEKLITLSQNMKDHFRKVDFSNLDRRDAVRRAFLMLSE